MLRKYLDHFPKIHPSCYIDESAQVIGDVEIGNLSSVWCNAVIRGDVNYIRIGQSTNIQDCSTLHVTYQTHPLILGMEITVGHGVVLHGCTIKDRCLIGMGAVILDGAVVGEEHLTVLKRAHSSWININVRIELDHADRQSARF